AVALAARGFFVRRRELLLGDVAVVALQLLLGLQLQAEVRNLLLAALTVLAGAVRALVDGGFRPAPQVFTHHRVEFVLGAMALGHEFTLNMMRPGPSPDGETISTAVHASSVVDHATRRDGGVKAAL